MNSAVSVVCLPLHPKVAAAQLNVPDINEGLTSFYPTVVGWGHHTDGDPFKQSLSETDVVKVAHPTQQKLAVPVRSTKQSSNLHQVKIWKEEVDLFARYDDVM